MGYHTRETSTVPCGYHELNPEMEALLAEYLEDGKRKGLQESSIHLHDKIGHYFLSALADTGCAAPQAMNAQNVGAACLMVSSKWYLSHIRTFLRYAYQARHTDRDYSGIVPLFKRPQPYPSVYTIEEILKIENSVDRDSPHGKRDYAVLLLATRLGIRSGDISSMTFRELDFGRNLILLTQHKTGVDIELPMVPDVKAALKQYLEEERSCYDSPYVFLRIVPPYSHISVQAITKIVRTAIMAAGIDPAGRKQGAHAFRSSLASSMVNDNIPYEAVRKALGHTDQNAIQSYASLDVEQLRNYALPVMEATGTFAAFLEGEVEPVMTQFQSVFKHELAEYLEISQGTVSDDTLRSTRRTLFSFDSLLVAENADRVTETAINHWIRELQQINAPKTVSDKVSYLRKFLRYLQYKGYSVFMPACPKTSDSYVPYIFSDREIQTLLSCADSWANRHTDPKTRRTDMEFCMLLRMLLGCGFRLGEPLAARVKDINFRNGTILIRHAKNNKQRVVPMDRTLTEMLERYCIAMGIKTEPESCLFPAARGQEFSVSKGTFDFRFRNLLRETGLYVQEKSHSRGQCLHCFRHYFAIHSFAQAEKNGRPTDDSVPFLSVYLGHHDMDETEKYLKFSGDMFPEYTELFEDYAAGVFTEVAYEENKLPEFMLLLEQFFTEYMPLSSGLSPNTTRSYKHAFRLLFQYVYQEKKKNAGEILFRDLNFETIDGFLKWIEAERGCSVSTRNLRLSALASFAGYAQNRNFEAATVFANAVKRVPVKKEAVQPRITFTLDEVSILLRLPDPGKRMGFRDQVLLNLMYASGARAQEICDLKVRDFLAEKNLYKLTITGKGNKTRRIVIARPSGTLLERYLEETGKAGRLEAYIFSSQTHPQMSISCIEEIYKKYIMLARTGHPEMFLEKRYTPHTMRHTTATHMLEARVPIMAIKNFLGHSSISTTERYAELSQGTVNRHIRDWNEKWFSHQKENPVTQKKEHQLPD